MKTLRYETGWNGGEYYLDDELISFKHKPKLTLIIKGKKYLSRYKEIYGTDDDHGHSYEWSRISIGIILTDGNLSSFLSIEDLPKRVKVYVDEY